MEQTSHLSPALTAVVLGALGLAAFGPYARLLESRSIVALASDQAAIQRVGELLPIKNHGCALQRAALETTCFLPIYGASEQNLQAAYNRPFHPTNLFRDGPTGFTVFPVGKDEATCLIILQKLAAVGPALEGRKVIVSVSPAFFFNRLAARPEPYAGNFSALQAGELAFNFQLSPRLRQDAARRMLKYPSTLANWPLLRFALENLADGSPLSLAGYYALFPLAVVQNAILQYQDHWNVVRYLWKHPELSSPPISPQSGQRLDWPMLHRKADELYSVHSNNNELGLDNEKWSRQLRKTLLRLRNTRSDAEFLHTVESSQEWVDLELVLRACAELGAHPLIVSMPIHGGWYDRCGITYTARRAYYQRLRETAARYHTPVVDFADHDGDPFFCIDNQAHPSPRGLVYFGEVLDGFVHGTLPRQSELPASGPVARRPTDAGFSPRSLR